MGRFDRDFSDTEYKEPTDGYTGEQPTPGIYPAKLVVCEEHSGGTGDAEKTHWVFEINDGDYEGWRGHTYTDDEGALWKEQSILVALGLLQPNEVYKGTHDKIMKSAKSCRIRVRREKYEGESRAKIGTVLPPGDNVSTTKAKRKPKDDDDEPGGSRRKDDDEPPF